MLEQTRGHYPAPLKAIEVMEAGLSGGIARGLKRTALPRKLDLEDVPTFGPQELEVARLVHLALLRDELR